MAIGVLSQKDQNGFLAATPLGQVVVLDELVFPEVGDGVEIQIETLSAQQFFALQRGDPSGAKALIHLWGDAVRVGRQIGGFGDDVESCPQRQPLVEDQIHNVTFAFRGGKLEPQDGEQGLGGRDHLGPRIASFLDQLGEAATR